MNEYPLRDKHGYLVNVILERDGFISLQAAAASEAVLTHGSV